MATSCLGKSKLKLRVREVAGWEGEMASISQESQQCPHHQSIAVVNALIFWGCAKVMVALWWVVSRVLNTSPHISIPIGLNDLLKGGTQDPELTARP